MKQIDELPIPNCDKMFQTPQKKSKNHKKISEIKPNSPPFTQQKQKFDLNESPRFKMSTGMRIDQEPSPGNQQLSDSIKLQFSSPMMAKIEESPYSSIQKMLCLKKQQELFKKKYGDLNMKENFKQCYTSILQEAEAGQFKKEILIPEIIDLENWEDHTYSQLLNFTLNLKNSRKLVFDLEKCMVAPVYQCLGCKIDFQNPPALGGHLRSCEKKMEHYEQLAIYEKLYEKSYMRVSLESDEDSSEEVKVTQMKKQIFRTPEKVCRLDDDANYLMTEKQRDSNSVYFSSENKSSNSNKSMLKSVPDDQKFFLENGFIFKGFSDSGNDEGCEEGSEEYMPSEEKTVKKERREEVKSENMESKKRKKITKKCPKRGTKGATTRKGMRKN